MHFVKFVLCCFATITSAGRFHKRQNADGSVSFELYAYGDGIGGLPVMSDGSQVFIGSLDGLNRTAGAVVTFTICQDGIWYGFPNSTSTAGNTTPIWSNLTLSIPSPSSGSDAVHLDKPSSTTVDRISDGFGFYGTVAYHLASGGAFESLWAAGELGSGRDLTAIQWNKTDSKTGTVPIILKSTPPSSGVP
ncbi:hypothetical protein BN1708_011943 [Verticillium longisporum]|uniref:Cellobiose dehydrogenase cytochrome domain-containing protein n=1 Tax=Verticillium longisporum TaxID=100787 RepID=A0A0G4L556_VERLO|nr:hypothetical protein BN1708_011943 [Verticillium longisporum]